ncbi:hypothetical protein EWM64_g8525 [Hericium alpestre]|uniref:N-acetyltransferase domain-containing protein n=1 Tax=Hericium alpestre TaxID=135208 RepID=A0A4Y9ZLI9_9AGAM|nr:hypothetical protein EWM64_g8525 [Hericium alpestre]
MQSPDKFQSDRLLYRGLHTADLDALHAIYSTYAVQAAETRDWVAPRPESFRDTLTMWSKCALFATVVEKESGRVVGTTSIRAPFQRDREGEVAIALAEDVWGKGYGIEVMRWTVERGFEGLGLHRLALGVFETNESAVAVYKKVGFVEEGRNRKAVWIEGRWWDVILMAILEDEYWVTKQKTNGA